MSADSLYPVSPTGVPAELSEPSAAYRRQAWVAFFGVVVFLIVYLGLTGYLSWIVYRLVSDAIFGGRAVLSLLFAAPAAFFLIYLLRGLVAVRRGEDAPRVEVTEQTQPDLLAFVNRVADDAGARRPHRVFVSARVNASVFYDITFRDLLLPSRKNLEIGLGLVEGLSLDELKGVLAHEFGHFGQGTMAVSRWVYLAEQIGAHIIGSRGRMDGFLRGLRYSDIRIAWIGWIMELFVWAIRSVLETAFRLVVRTHRALSREMEFQADLVAVSLSGSDSLIHALHRLGPAQTAWDRAAQFAQKELASERPVQDLFAVQGAILAHLRVVLCDDTFGRTPARPTVGGEAHRVFKQAVALPPRMWSTHPPNLDREENAKRRYIGSTLDARPAWALFQDAEALRREVTVGFYARGLGASPEREPVPIEESLERIDEDFGRPSLNRRYRGIYLGRSVVSSAPEVDDLYGTVNVHDREALLQAIDALYPAQLTEQLERWFELREEHAQLEALQEGVLAMPGGVVRWRGEVIARSKLESVAKSVAAERDQAHELLLEHDRRVRGLHLAAAGEVSRRWQRHLRSLVQLVHYTDHVAADLRDAHGSMLHILNVALVDGHLSRGERREIVAAGAEVFRILRAVYQQRAELRVPPAIEDRAGDVWREFVANEFGLLMPADSYLADWLSKVDSWVFGTAVALEVLSRAALEALLEAEDYVATTLREGSEAEPPPDEPEVPDAYQALVEGDHREREKRLGWWDRFVVADGAVPGALRFLVASAVLVPALLLGAFVASTATLRIYNGLGVPVTVTVAGESVSVPSHAADHLPVDAHGSVQVRTTTERGQEVEAFAAAIEHAGTDYAYNVASAAALFSWEAVYNESGGRDTEARPLGARRFLPTDADVIFTDPPQTVSVSSRGATARREVLAAALLEASSAEQLVSDATERRRMAAAHLRFDPVSEPLVHRWAALLPEAQARAIVAERARAEADVLWLRLEQILAPEDAREAVCDRHRARAAAEPGTLAYVYAVTRCIEDGEQREARWLALAAAHRQDLWFSFAAGHAHARHGRWVEALASLGRTRPLRATWPSVAIEIARIRRVMVPDLASAHTSDLIAASRELAVLLAGDMPGPVNEPPEHPALSALRALQVGQLAQAVAAARQLDGQARIIRLAAASSSAAAEILEEARALPDDAGLDHSTMFATLALAVREGGEWQPLLARVADELSPQDQPAIRRLVTDGFIGGDPAVVDDVAGGLDPRLRGHVYAMGVVFYRVSAPDTWRHHARALLFASERPYLGRPVAL